MSEDYPAITLSSDSWHHKLFTFTYGQYFGEPEDFTNLCPYFWLVMCALLISPFKFIFYSPFVSLRRYIKRVSHKMYINWVEGLTQEEMTQYYAPYSFSEFVIKPLPMWVQFNNTRIKVLNDWLNIYASGREERTKIVESMLDVYNKKYDQYNLKRAQNYKPSRSKELYKSIDSYIESKAMATKEFSSNVKKKILSMSTLIKYTKRVVGAIISMLFAVIYYYIIYLIVALIPVVILYQAIILNIIVKIGVLFVVAVVGYLIFRLIGVIARYLASIGWSDYYYGSFAEKVVDNLLDPIFTYLLFIPVKFIFVTFLWRGIIIGVLFNFFYSLWKGFLSSSGIFGQYLKSDYSGYCMGVKWNQKN